MSLDSSSLSFSAVRPSLHATRLLSLLALLLFAACSSTQPVSVQLSDAEIATKVKAKLVGDPEVNPFRVDVDVNEGLVRLSGVVEKEEAKREAGRLARQTEGVRRVQNDLVVGKPSVAERAQDAGIASMVKSRIAADPDLNPFNINVDSEGSTVTLMGRVKTERAKKHAEEVARATKGVEDVRNMLEVGPIGDDS